jgi:hypothetical protein
MQLTQTNHGYRSSVQSPTRGIGGLTITTQVEPKEEK